MLLSRRIEALIIVSVSRNNSCFVDFESIEDAQQIMERHQVRPFRDGGRILRINFNVEKIKFPPYEVLCISSYTGDPAELETYFPSDQGDNHIESISGGKHNLDLTSGCRT